MAEPVQLRYTDINDNEQVIGTYLREDNLIQQFEMKNSGSGEFTRIELIADKQFKDNLPIDYTQYGTDEPEIRVYIDDGAGGWKLRDRVFAEKSGVLDDEGKYRNDELWGFQKWVGRQKTPNKISLSNASITTIVQELLPSGYVAETPSGDTVPTLDNYSFNGKRDRAIRDLVRDYPVKIWFTAETDANDDYIVKVQSKGYGGVVQSVEFTDERQTSGYQIIEFDEEDKSNIVNKVEVEGVDSNGDTVRATAEDSTSISEHGERYVHRSVGYIESQSQAQNIADDILNPDPSPHAVMSVGFIDENAINSSIDVVDDRFGIDAVYTIVKQRDFMTEGKTEVELSFEKNRSEERRNLDRDLDEKNHQLFPSSTQDVGNQTVDADTEDVDESYDAHASAAGQHDVGGQSYVEDTDDTETNEGVTTFNNLSDGITGILTINTDFVSGETDVTFLSVQVTVENNSSTVDGYDLEIENTDTGTTYFNENNFIEGDAFPINGIITASTMVVSQENLEGDSIDFKVTNNKGGDRSVQISASVCQLSEFTINQPEQFDGAQPEADGSTNNTNPSDSSAGDTTSLNASGSTEGNVNVDTALEEKTNR